MSPNHFRMLYWTGCGAIALASVLVGRQNLGGFAKVPPLDLQRTIRPALYHGLVPRAQSMTGRTMRDLKWRSITSFRATLNAAPSRIIPSIDGDVFVLDMNDSTVKEYSSEGKLLHRYSATGDETPGRIADFALGSDRTVWTADPNGEVAGIKADGSVPWHLKELHAMRLAWMGDRLLVQTVPSPALPFGDKLFITVSPDGRVLTRFGQLVDDTADFGIAVFGQTITESKRNRLVYAPYPTGLLALYGSDGEQYYVAKTIEPLPLPLLEITSRGATHLPLPSEGATRDIAVTDENILVLSGTKDGQKTKPLIDIYNVDTGQYRYSFELPSNSLGLTFDSRSFAVSKDILYVSTGNALHLWRTSDGF